MAKKYIGGFTDGFGFKRTSNKPMDDSDIVEFIADLTNGTIDKPYPMMEVGVLEDLQYYSWNGGDITLMASWIPRGANGASNAAITTNGTVPALAPGISGSEIRSLISAGAMNRWNARVDAGTFFTISDNEALELLSGSNIDLSVFKLGSIVKVIISLPDSITTPGSVTADGGFISNGGFRVNQSGPYLDVFTTDPMGKCYMTWNKTVNGVTTLKGFFGFAHSGGLDDDIYIQNQTPTGRIRFGTGARATYNDIIINIDGSVDIKKLNSEILSLVKAQETSVPAQTNTITMGVPGANNYHSLRNVPISLFKQYLFGIADTDWVTLTLKPNLSASTLQYRRKNGKLLVAGSCTSAVTGNNLNIGTLSIGFRPNYTFFGICHFGNGSVGNIRIVSSGDIYANLVSGATYELSLEFLLDNTF